MGLRPNIWGSVRGDYKKLLHDLLSFKDRDRPRIPKVLEILEKIMN